MIDMVLLEMMLIPISGSKKLLLCDISILINVCYIDVLILHMKLTECCYLILVTKICNGGRISYILANFIPNISALNSKHLTH